MCTMCPETLALTRNSRHPMTSPATFLHRESTSGTNHLQSDRQGQSIPSEISNSELPLGLPEALPEKEAKGRASHKPQTRARLPTEWGSCTDMGTQRGGAVASWARAEPA